MFLFKLSKFDIHKLNTDKPVNLKQRRIWETIIFRVKKSADETFVSVFRNKDGEILIDYLEEGRSIPEAY